MEKVKVKVNCCNLIGYFFIGIFIAALVALPVGIGIFVSYNNGKLGEHELHRSGYICGTEPPTKEEIAARNNIPTCLYVTHMGRYPFANRTDYKLGPLCLQSGKLDKPAVWCNEVRPLFLWWSPCNKCGTAWRIFDEIDNDQSWYKRPTSSQPNNSAVPPQDGWLRWDQGNEEWMTRNDLVLNSCPSEANISAANVNNTSYDYDIPASCFSDNIYIGVNPWSKAGLPLLIVGTICWYGILCSFLQSICPNDGRGGDFGGGGGGKISVTNSFLQPHQLTINFSCD